MRHRSDRDTDDSIVSRPAESVVSNRTGVLPVRVNPISTGSCDRRAVPEDWRDRMTAGWSQKDVWWRVHPADWWAQKTIMRKMA